MRSDNMNGPEDAVLIVDDDPAMAAFMEDVVEAFFQIKVLRAETTQAARDLFKRHAEEIRAMLCDFSIGNDAGTRLVKEFCAMRPDLNVIFVTGHLFDEEKLSKVVGREVGLIMKPFGPFELKAALDQSLWAAQGVSYELSF
jgi:DNA-binding response OmpR family regulator